MEADDGSNIEIKNKKVCFFLLTKNTNLYEKLLPALTPCFK